VDAILETAVAVRKSERASNDNNNRANERFLRTEDGGKTTLTCKGQTELPAISSVGWALVIYQRMMSSMKGGLECALDLLSVYQTHSSVVE
jgi:hypothetical protein